jgi:signal transduction histidine kinase
MSDPTLIGRGPVGRGLSLFGAALLTWAPIALYIRGGIPLSVLVGAIVANAAWILLALLPSPPRLLVAILLGVMVLTGGLTAAAMDGSSIVPAGVAVLWVTRDIRIPSWRGLMLAGVTIVLVVVGYYLSPISLLGLLAIGAGVIVAFLAGLSRRQFVLAEIRSRELVQEHTRTDVLGARAQLASEIHDVLAHSLGGLVIQLDAVDALLESGDATAAAAKVREARVLAAEGLSEARRAVAALSESPTEPPARVPAGQVVADVSALVTAHDSLGGEARLRQSGAGRDVTTPVELALRRAVQEGLTNARKHAPGERVDVVLTWSIDSVELQITNHVGHPRATPSGGHGLVGMRERFASLPGGSASAARSGDDFVVTVRASTA